MRKLTATRTKCATNMNGVVWLGTVVLSLTSTQYLFSQTTFNDGGVHNITTDVVGPIDVSQGPQGATTLNVLSGGTISGVITYSNNSTYAVSADSGGIVNISGGGVSGGSVTSNGTSYGVAAGSGGIVSISSGRIPEVTSPRTASLTPLPPKLAARSTSPVVLSRAGASPATASLPLLPPKAAAQSTSPAALSREVTSAVHTASTLTTVVTAAAVVV